MQIVGRIFKEIIIATVLLGLLFLVGYLLFKNQFSFLSSDVPNAIKYTKLDLSQYDIKGDLEDQKDPTKVFQATASSLKTLETLRKVHTGTPNPFSDKLDKDKETDIPTEKVSIQNVADANATSKQASKDSTTSDGVQKTITMEDGQYTESWVDDEGFHMRSTDQFDDDGNPIFSDF